MSIYLSIVREIRLNDGNLLNNSILVVAFIIFIFLGSINKVYAAESCESPVAQIVSIQGAIELRRVKETIWRQATMNATLCAGDMIRARSHSRAALRLSNESILRLDERTAITFPQSEENEKTSLLDMFSGAIHIITRTPKPFKVRTPFLNATVDGTEFFVGVDEESTSLVIYEGQVTASNDQGHLVLVDHEAAIAIQGQPPQKEVIISLVDAVQWALHYPTIIDYWSSDDIDNVQSARSLIAKAAYLLSIGRVDEAEAVIAQVQMLDSNDSDAYALRAMIALVKIDKAQALKMALRAVELEETSVVARLALSYAQQAHFEIEAALASVQQAVKFDPQNALIWARLAELQMSDDEIHLAMEAAKKAVSLNSSIARTQTVLGFAHLLEIDTDEAKQNFAEAIRLDQVDPMPRLGIGLALIREGALEDGRIELEIAASLDPSNSLIRSYLGKAYFEEKRYPLASKQFEIAKERDPNDPTPWFYDAIQKQTQNRPIEALRDIQKSIELNDNRAVYRSRLLLDQDEAARGSSLARIYDNLGFERRALMETAKSLSFDPSSHSAHRFLSDTYANIPRHEIARVSELLQAQLLQPINVNPVQPHLAVADLNIITNTGPANVGFNEFAPLMERNRPQLVASGIAGSNNTFGNELVYSQLHERTSVSLGQFHYQSNGFRKNNGQNHDIFNAFIQHAFTPKLNVQAEVRTRESEHGQLLLDFGRNNEGKSGFDENFRRRIKEDTARIGARYELSPDQNLIVSGKYVNRVEHNGPDEFNISGFQLETQHLWRHEYLNTILGGGVYQFDRAKRNNAERKNIYFYTNINYFRDLNLTVGLSYDLFDSAITGLREDKINPKFGVQWSFFDNLRFRAAWFETTKSRLIAQQTLEPTQVAGFNQFFDDINDTRAQRMGVGLDYHVSHILYGGIEVSKRLLHVPLSPLGFVHLQKQKERLYRTYFYWTPHPFWAVKGELQLEKYTRDSTDEALIFSIDPVRIRTVSAPVNVEFFHPSGIFSGLTGTFIEQDLTRLGDLIGVREQDGETYSGTDAFFLLDALLGYRLPNRRGLLSLEGRNLLNNNFQYRSINFNQSEAITPRFTPDRTFFVRLTLNF